MNTSKLEFNRSWKYDNKYKIYSATIKKNINEFYIRSKTKLIKEMFTINYNNNSYSDFFNEHLKKEYEYSYNRYYIYKFKLNDYYLINQFEILTGNNIEIYFEYDDDNYFKSEYDEITQNKKNQIIFAKTFGKEKSNIFNNNYCEINVYIEYIDIYNDNNNFDRIYENNLTIIKNKNNMRLIIPDKYIDNFNDYGFYLNIKRNDTDNNLYSYSYRTEHVPLEEIIIL